MTDQMDDSPITQAEISELVQRAAAVRASLRPAPSGFSWQVEVSDRHEPGAWGYRNEQATVRITWTLERDSHTPNTPDSGTET